MNENKHILIDLGSSTVKIYLYVNNALTLIQAKSLPFRNGFNEISGISQENKKLLFLLINDIRDSYPDTEIDIYATALFRKIIPDTQVALAEEILTNTGASLTILSHDEENKYIELALLGNFTLNDPVLIINIGGGSTELALIKNKELLEKHNLNLGVGTILQEYPSINSVYSEIPIQELETNIASRLPILQNPVSIAFHTGGELTYMSLTGYLLKDNTLFNEPSHPKIITDLDFIRKNEEVFSRIKLLDLEMLMPENPAWMQGARACSAIAQAIVDKYQINTIIPSNSNIIDGIVREKYSGSL